MKSLAWTLFFHPLLAMVGAVPLVILFQTLKKQFAPRQLILFAVLPVTLFCLFGFSYLFLDTYLDQIESGIISNAWSISKGIPFYHELDAPGRYSYVYGPILYLLNDFFMWVFGPTFLSSKLLGVICSWLCVFQLYRLAKFCIHDKTHSILVWGLSILGLLAFGPVAFYARADAPLLLIVTTATLLTLRLNQHPKTKTWESLSLIGALLGLAVNLKPHAFLYFLPLCILILFKFNWKKSLYTLLLSLTVFAIPFLIRPELISFHNYFTLLSRASQFGPKPSLELGIQNLEWLVLLLLPLGLKSQRRNVGMYEVATLLTCIFIAIIAARPSASSSHLLPLFPLLIGIFYFRPIELGQPSWFKRIILGSQILSLTFISVWALGYQAQFISKTYHSDAAQDLRSIIQKYEGKTLSYAFGGSDYFKFSSGLLRPLISFSKTGFNYFDLPAAGEMMISKIPIPESTLKWFRECKTQVWVSSRDTDPFMGSEYYGPLGLEFKAHYLKSANSKYFDVWTCRPR